MGGSGEAGPDGEAGYGIGSLTGAVAALPTGGLPGDGGGYFGGLVESVKVVVAAAEDTGFGGGTTEAAEPGAEVELVTAGFGGGSAR